MSDAAVPASAEPADSNTFLDTKAKELDLRLKELDVQNKEYEASHRPSPFRVALANPAVIAAVIAAWASLTAAGLTWLSGQISADRQREAAAQQAALQREAAVQQNALEQKKFEANLILEQRKFEANLILDSIRTGDAVAAAQNLDFLVSSGLLTGDLATSVHNYLARKTPPSIR